MRYQEFEICTLTRGLHTAMQATCLCEGMTPPAHFMPSEQFLTVRFMPISQHAVRSSRAF